MYVPAIREYLLKPVEEPLPIPPHSRIKFGKRYWTWTWPLPVWLVWEKASLPLLECSSLGRGWVDDHVDLAPKESWRWVCQVPAPRSLAEHVVSAGPSQCLSPALPFFRRSRRWEVLPPSPWDRPAGGGAFVRGEPCRDTVGNHEVRVRLGDKLVNADWDHRCTNNLFFRRIGLNTAGD